MRFFFCCFFQLGLVLKRFECEEQVCRQQVSNCENFSPLKGAVIYQFESSSSGVFDFASTTNSDESDELLFRMRFRTAQYDAVILGSSGSTYVINGTAYTNAIFIQLLNGQLVVSLSVGSQPLIEFVEPSVNDDRWHHFSIRQLVQGNLQFFFDDRLADEHSAYEISYRPNIPGPIYIGHFPVFSEAKVTDKPYLGCLADVVYDGFDLLKNSILTNVQMSHSCQASASSFSFRTSDSGVKKQLFISPVSLDLNIEFRFVAPGSILRLSNINGVNLAINISQNNLMLFINELIEPIVLAKFTSKTFGQWLLLALQLSEMKISVILRGLGQSPITTAIERKFGSPDSRDRMADIRLGGEGFVGCMRRWTVGGKLQNLSGSDISVRGMVNLSSCIIADHCHPNPCMNGGQCISGKELPITCQCPDSYWGRYCQLSLLPASCDEFFGYFNNDTAKKGIGLEVHLDLDGSGELEPFVVNCSKTTDERTLTILQNSIADPLIVNSYRFIGRHRHEIDYQISQAALNFLVDEASRSCSQSVVFRCFNGTKIGNSGNGGPYSLWEGRSRSSFSSWGSAEPESAICSCGRQGTCINHLNCNCDSGENTSDEGEISAAEHLPVLAVDIGGIDNFGKSASISIGPLKCHSGTVDNTVMFTTRASAMTLPVRRKSIFEGRLVEVKLEFRTSVAEGVLWFSESQYGSIKLFFENDWHLSADFGYGGHLYSVDFFSSMPLNDDRWHRVVLTKVMDEVTMIVDSFKPVSTRIPFEKFWFGDHILLGGSDLKSEGFRGFVRNLLINGKSTKFDRFSKESRDFAAIPRLCDSQPCLNGGVCQQHYDHFTCDCSLTEFDGSLCDKEIGLSLETGSSLITTVLPSDSFSADSFIRIGFKIQRKSAFSGVTILDISFGDSQLTMLKLLVSTEGELQIAYNSSTGNYKLMLLSSTHNYSDGQFYDMKIHINLKNELSIEVDQEVILTTKKFFIPGWSDLQKVSAGRDLLANSRDSHRLCVSRMRVGSQTPLKAFRQADFPKNLQVVGVATRSDCFSAPVAIATAAATNSATCRTTVLSSKINEEGDLHPEIIIMPLVKQTNTAWLGVGAGAIILLLFILGCCLARWIYHYPGGTYKTHENEFLTSDSTDTALTTVPLRTREYFM